MSEIVLADFHGGMNAQAAPDKLDQTECLVAENVRLDETGNIAISGANTKQNTASYADSSNTANVHSLYWNPSLGAVAGVGKDVFQGPTLGGMSSKLVGSNTGAQKMSFASAPNRVYFDVGSQGYWSDLTNLLTVDWAPPSASSAVTTGPNTAGTFGVSVNTATASGFGFSLSTAGMQGVTSTITATFTVSVNFNGTGAFNGNFNGTMTARMFVGGGAVGTATSQSSSFNFNGSGPGVQNFSFVTTFIFGNANSLWGDSSLSPTQVSSSNFGFQFSASASAGSGSSGLSFNSEAGFPSGPCNCTVYQGAGGFTAGTGTTGTLTGTYSWKFTFVAANGEESDASTPSSTLTLSGQQGTLTAIPSGDARTVSRNIYRKGGALTSYYLVGSIPDTATTVFSDNQTDIAALTAGVILAGDVPGDYPNSRLGNQTVRFPVLHYDRVFWIVPGTNKVIWSKPLNGFAYPAINFLNVGNSAPCTRLISIFGELIIFKSDASIWRLTGNDEASFDLTQTPASNSTDQSFTIVALPDKVTFANRYGPFLFNGYTSQKLTPKLDLWFLQEDRSGKSVISPAAFHAPEITNSAVIVNEEAVGNSDKLYWAYAEAGQPANNSILVFDLVRGNITKRTLAALSLAIDPVTGFVYAGDANGFVSRVDDFTGANDRGSPVTMNYQTGYIDVARGSNKGLYAIELYLNTNGQSLNVTAAYDNGASSEVLAPISTTKLQRVVRTLESSNSRKAQSASLIFNASSNQVNTSGTPQIVIAQVKLYYQVYPGRARTGQ